MFWSLRWCSFMKIYETKQTRSTYTCILYSSRVWKQRWERNRDVQLTVAGEFQISNTEVLLRDFFSPFAVRSVRICFTQIWTGDWRLLQNALHVLTHYLDGLSQRKSRSMSENLRFLSFCAVYGTSLISSEKDLKYNNGLLKIDFFCFFLQEEFKVARFMDFIWCVIYITPN